MFRRQIILVLIVFFAASFCLHGCRRVPLFKGKSSGGNYTPVMDVPYATLPGVDTNLTSLNLYIPKKGNHHAVLIFIHGGGWKAGDKNSGWRKGRDRNQTKAEAFTEQGYVFASINYRLSPAVMHPVHVQDVAKAIAWIYKNVWNYGGDPERLFVMGHSAGAHLAALVSTDERYLKAEGRDLNILKGVILLDGAGYDIPKVKEMNASYFDMFYKLPFGDDTAVLKDASPVSHVEIGKGIPPFLLVHAGKREMSAVETQWLAKTLKDAGVRADVFHAQDKNHLSLNRDIGKTDDATTAKIFEFLEDADKKNK